VKKICSMLKSGEQFNSDEVLDSEAQSGEAAAAEESGSELEVDDSDDETPPDKFSSYLEGMSDRSRIEDAGKGIAGSDADTPANRTDALQATPLQAASLGMI
jgi:hypothetical protein